MYKKLRAIASTLAFACAAAGLALAQATSGDLVGTVKDASGALLPNATITIKAESTGVTVTTQTGSSGEFRAGNLLPDKYDLVVNATGFQPYTLRGVNVELNKASTADVVLSVNGASQTVEVSADAGVVLDTTTSNLSQTFTPREIADLPTATVGLGVLNVSLLSPGVASSGGIGIGTGPSVGGQRPRNNNFTIEGIDNNDTRRHRPAASTCPTTPSAALPSSPTSSRRSSATPPAASSTPPSSPAPTTSTASSMSTSRTAT